jgi:hypothetical protein
MSVFRKRRIAVLAAALAAAGGVEAAVTYQGELRESGQPANGPYDVQFCLFADPAGGSSLACHDADDLAVVAGRFAAVLDFDAGDFPGGARFVELRVRPGAGTGSHTTLAPRQALHPTPYAHTALSVPDASITAGKLAAGAVTAGAIAANAVAGGHVADASITGADLANATIGVAKVDTAQVQARVAGSCPDGEFMRAILADGGVICAPTGGAAGGGFGGILDEAGNQGLSNSLVLGTNGLPIVSYYDGDTGALKIARCDDAACDDVQRRTLFTPDFVLDPENGPQKGTAIAIGAGGRPLIAFVDLKDESLKLIRCGDALCDGTLSLVPLATRGLAPSIALGADGLPVIAATDDTYVFVLKCDDAACASFSVNRPYQLPEFTVAGDISILNNGVAPFLAFARYGTNPPARVTTVSCNDARCATAALNTITPTTEDALLPDAARYALGGFPVVAYYDRNTETLKFAFCGNASCSTVSSFRSIDGGNGGIIGPYPSLAIDSAGFPVVSYLAAGIGLRVARCSSPNCAEAPSISPVDVGGTDSSLVLRPDGIPVISHYDAAQKDLRLTVCGNANCVEE